MAKTVGVKIPVLNMLKADHKKVKQLFESYEDASKAEKKHLAATILHELTVHAKLEEELIYPTIRKAMKKDEQAVMNEAEVEHHVAHGLIGELKKMSGPGDMYDAKITVLGELVKHHAKEEEEEMFPQAGSCDIDWDLLEEQAKEKKARILRTMTTLRKKSPRPTS